MNEDTLVKLIDTLNALAVPYMLVGSLASNVYGIPRSTQDADFVIQSGIVSLPELTSHLGPAVRLDPQPSFDPVTSTLRHVLHLRESAFKIEVFILGDDSHDQERFRRRRQVRLLNRLAYILAVEDVVITKLRWAAHLNRAKDIEDVRNVVNVQGDRIDWHYVLPWCDQHGTRALLDQIRGSLPTT
ncbi:MAG: hypothetical protein JNM56_35185 [Planctomycetia bacterium]|nr:hypothetical protein [Planctomycetia bacterium]